MTTTRAQPRTRATTTAITRRAGGAPVDVLAREAGVHPDLARRLIRLGLLEPADALPRDAAAQLARAVRLRRDLGLNYSGAILACALLKRIDELEARLRALEVMR